MTRLGSNNLTTKIIPSGLPGMRWEEDSSQGRIFIVIKILGFPLKIGGRHHLTGMCTGNKGFSSSLLSWWRGDRLRVSPAWWVSWERLWSACRSIQCLLYAITIITVAILFLFPTVEQETFCYFTAFIGMKVSTFRTYALLLLYLCSQIGEVLSLVSWR